jgi:hypothetical protein
MNRTPYVGTGADGARRSAQIDREEADTLHVNDPRFGQLLNSAAEWDRQADRIERQFVPIWDRTDQRPESSLEARWMAQRTLTAIFGNETLSGKVDADRIAHQVMLRWDQNCHLDIVEAVGEAVRCRECNGAGAYPGAFAQDCVACDGEGVKLDA